jgi:histone-lysine N-methyltransferase SETD2
MLNIECEKRTCPCGEQCSNQQVILYAFSLFNACFLYYIGFDLIKYGEQFQRRSYAKISWFHSGKKGYGLQLQEEVSEGRFLIEYVGEVPVQTAYVLYFSIGFA